MSVALVQYKTAGGTVTMDSVPIDGNLLVMWMTERATGDFPSAPAGWSSIATAQNGGGAYHARLCTRTAASETGTFSLATAGYIATVMEWSGATFGAEVHQSDQNTADLAVPLTCGGAITPAASNSVVVGCGVVGDFGGTGVSPDAGVTEIADVQFSGSNAPDNWVGYKAVVSPASTTIGGTMSGRKEFGGVTFTLLAAPDPPTPGMWYDFDRDGFGSAGATSTDAPLARMLPEGGSTLTDLVTSDVISVQIDRVADTTGGTPIGSMIVTTKNTSGTYNPDNSSSTVYGKIGPGLPVWFGCNADGTLSGTGQTVYGRFAGYLKTQAPMPVGGAVDAPTVQWVFDDAMVRYRNSKARIAFAQDRSVAQYRTAILTAIGETRTSLATEADILPISGEIGVQTLTRSRRIHARPSDATFLAATAAVAARPVVSALAVLEDLNHLVGTRHYVAPADTKESWYAYTTRNRQYKLGSAADAALTVGIHDMAGYVTSRDGVVNQIAVEARPFRIAGQSSTVWEYSTLPFSIHSSTSKLIVADFGDLVFGATVSLASTNGNSTATMVAYGDGASIQVTSTGPDIVTGLSVTGTPIIRLDSIMVEQEDAASAAAYGPMQGPTLGSDYMTSEGLAEGIAAYSIWADKNPRKTPTVGIFNRFATILPLDLFDVVTLTEAQLDVSAKRFEIIGLHEAWSVAASADLVLVDFTLDLRETTNPSAMSLLTFGTSLYAGPDTFAP